MAQKPTPLATAKTMYRGKPFYLVPAEELEAAAATPPEVRDVGAEKEKAHLLLDSAIQMSDGWRYKPKVLSELVCTNDAEYITLMKYRERFIENSQSFTDMFVGSLDKVIPGKKGKK